MVNTIINNDESAFRVEEKWLCLDFVNTLDWRTSDHPEEMLDTYAALAGWGLEKGVISETSARQLNAEAARCPKDAAEVLKQAIDLREAIYRLLMVHLLGDAPRPEDLDLLNQSYSAFIQKLLVVPSGVGYKWAWSINPHHLDEILGPVTYSAAGLLTSGDLERVGMCADETGCGWLFYDTSRNHSRRWCDMKSCGNRAKAREHYARKKNGAGL